LSDLDPEQVRDRDTGYFQTIIIIGGCISVTLYSFIHPDDGVHTCALLFIMN
jgi:hypothetical protein